MVSQAKEVAYELLPFLKVYKDGTVERFLDSPVIPPSLSDPATEVSSRDVAISPEVSARLYLPAGAGADGRKLPILVYFHGGGFCIESAFSFLSHRYLTALVSISNVLAISVEYRLAPEHPLPAAYTDSWAALRWVALASDPWLALHGDLSRIYLGGDSAGANIAHNIAVGAAGSGGNLSGGVEVLGVVLSHPFFWGSEAIGSEPQVGREKNLLERTWRLVFPGALDGLDKPMINPFAVGAPKLSGIRCSRVLVCVAGKDELRDRGIRYYEAVKESGWKGNLELYEESEEGHCFHVLNPENGKAQKMMKRLASFLI